MTTGTDLPSDPIDGSTEICAPLAFTRTGVCSERKLEESWLLANGLLISVDRKAPVASKPKAMTVTPIALLIGMLLSQRVYIINDPM
jgi:hypothetical protein